MVREKIELLVAHSNIMPSAIGLSNHLIVAEIGDEHIGRRVTRDTFREPIATASRMRGLAILRTLAKLWRVLDMDRTRKWWGIQ